jgi:chaperonin GroES
MNWQLTEQMEEWEEDMDILLLVLPIYGVGVKKTYFDPVLNRNVSKTLRVDEFAAPYGVTRLEDAPRMTHSYMMHINDIKINGKNNIWINTEDLKAGTASEKGTKMATEHKQATDESTGSSDSPQSNDRPRLILEQHRTLDLNGDGIEEPYIVTVDEESGNVLRIEERTYDYFTSYSFIPNPDSWMGFGFGHLLEHLNHSANTLINQLMDSGTLANTISGFVNRRSGIKTGDLSFDIGQFKSVDLPTDEINKAIYQFKFNPPSQVLFALLQMLQGYSRELSSVSETMLGKLPPSDTTATSMLAVMEQGLKVFSTIHKRIHRVFKKELKKIAALNAIFLNETVYFTVQDSTSQEMKTFESGRKDFANTIDVKPVSDPTITSRAEKLIKAQQAYELGLQSPLTSQDQIALYELTKNLFVALEVPNIDKILKKPEPQEPPDLRPEEEESEFLAERYVNPLPRQDHQDHLTSHRVFENSQWATQLTPQGKKLLDAHIKETMALLYLQIAQRQEAEGAINELNGGGLPGVAEPAVLEGTPETTGGARDIEEPGLG